MGGMNLANKISIARIILIPFFIATIVYSKMHIALILFLAATVSDGIDGFIARTFKQKTELGTILDPMADKLLLISAYICLSMVASVPPHLKLPAYVSIIVISRDVIIILGSVTIYFITGELKVSPSAAGKLTTFFQMLTIMSILAQVRHSYVVWNLTVLLTVVSGIDYIMKGSRILNGNPPVFKKERQA